MSRTIDQQFAEEVDDDRCKEANTAFKFHYVQVLAAHTPLDPGPGFRAPGRRDRHRHLADSWGLLPGAWSIVAMAGFLWLYCKYFSGSWWPRATAEARRDRFRAVQLPVGVWKWSVVAAMLFVVIAQSGLVVTFRLIKFPAEAFAAGYNVDGMPLWLAWLGILVASSVAGICEETGLRGYLQFPLERRYGPGIWCIPRSVLCGREQDHSCS